MCPGNYLAFRTQNFKVFNQKIIQIRYLWILTRNHHSPNTDVCSNERSTGRSILRQVLSATEQQKPGTASMLMKIMSFE
ncbi:unnamed protein product [Schistosoma haematobium]|nr:unnamed protein product [Schistosoma haematobium]